MRGPVGGYFVWEPTDRPLLLIGGGSGIAPLRSMWRTGTTHGGAGDGAVLRADPRPSDLPRRADRRHRHHVTIHLTRDDAPGYASGRIGTAALDAAIDRARPPEVYVCGPTAFVETVATTLVDLLGHDHPIRTERFG